MLSFLDYEKVKLNHQSDFNSIYDNIKKLYLKGRGYNNLVSGLLSSDKSKVVWALNELSEKIYNSTSLENSKIEISTLLNKVLLQADPALEDCIYCLSAFVSNKVSTKLLKPNIEFLQIILKQYYEQELQGYNKPFVQQQLINIADTLFKWGIKNEVIDFWIDRKIKTRFNNIKYNSMK